MSFSELKPLTVALLEHPDTRLTLSDQRVRWESFDQDSRILAQIFALLKQTAAIPDAQFRQKYLPRILGLFEQTSLMENLQDSSIVTTPAHRGILPAAHIEATVRGVNTQPLRNFPWAVILLRAAALLHDVGKGLSAGATDNYRIHWPENIQILRRVIYQTWGELEADLWPVVGRSLLLPADLGDVEGL